MKNFTQNYCYILCSIFLFSCAKTDITQTNSESQEIIVSSKAQLNEFETDPTVVDYKLARQLAHIDMTINNTFEQLGWSECSISKEPVIIYGFDDKPLYYDFMIINNDNTPKGSISVHARKNDVMQIRKTSKEISIYTRINTKSSAGNVFYADMYGRKYSAIRNQTKTGVISAQDMITGEIVHGLKSMSKVEIINAVRNNVLSGHSVSSSQTEATINSIINRESAKQAAANQFWEMVEQNKSEIMSYGQSKSTVNSEPINLMFKNISTDIDDTDNPYPGDNTEGGGGGYYPPNINAHLHGSIAWLKEYHNWFGAYPVIDGFCGPWVVGYILSTNYHQNIEAIKFDIEGYTVQGEVFRGAMTAPCMNNAIKDYSRNQMSLGLSGMSSWDTYWRIRHGNAAVRMMIKWAGAGDTEWHLTLLYGSYRIERALATNYYFMQADNGTIINEYNRGARNPYDNMNYDELQWFDTLFPVEDLKRRQ